MTEQEYAEHVDRRHEELRERMQEVLRKLSTAFAEEGYIASPVYDRSDDEYGYAFVVSGGNLVEEVDVSLTLAESFSYGDLDGVSFALDIVAFGGEIVGGLTPYNYTPDCWVPVDDAEAVSDRLAIIEQANGFDAVYLVREWAERRLAPMLAAYVECAIWASPTEDGEPLDDSFGLDDLTDEARAKMASDLADFLRLCHEKAVDLSDLDAEQVGHDFWLTRNRHGAGFWDRGLGERGEMLTKLANSFGETYLYLADDGTLDLI